MKRRLAGYLRELGFELVGFCRPDPPAHFAAFEGWVGQGLHAGMVYLASERSLACRADPALLLPEVRTVVVVGLRYANPAHPPEPEGDSPHGRVAAYAWGADYHEVIVPLLEQAARQTAAWLGRPAAWRAYTDTGPILERDFASTAGLGWIGKNTCLISPRHGSYFLLGELLLDVALEPDPPFTSDQCGSCRRCIEACPTACIRPDRTLEAGRCISYLTIEHKGAIPPELRPLMGDWVFGCDVCQQVCPWNLRFAGPTGSPALSPRARQAQPGLVDELRLDPAAFNRKFKGAPQMRAKRRGYLRNVAVALGNSGDAGAVQALAECLMEDLEPLVRAHAAWALGQIGTRPALAALEKALRLENSPDVIAEIRAALDAGSPGQPGG